MKQKFKKTMILLTITAFILINFKSVESRGLGVGPSFIILEDAYRGAAPYQQTVYIYNEDDVDANIHLSCEGDICPWVTFYDYSNRSEPIDQIFVPKRSDKPIIVNISIPDDTASKEYNGTIYAKMKPANDTGSSGSSTSVELSIPVPVFINVTGDQILKVNVTGIDIEEEEVNRDLDFTIRYSNEGNVVGNPVANILITKDGNYMDELNSKNYTPRPIRPGEIGKHLMNWDTTGFPPGEYNAYIKIMVEDEIIKETNISFEIYPPGTFTREGDLTEITYDGTLEKGKIVRIIGVFVNRGEVETNAKFYAEVYKDGELIETLESAEKTVQKFKQKGLITYLTINENGKYRINGYVVYDGNETSPKELVLNVGVGGASGIIGFLGPIVSNPAILILLLAAVVILVVLMLDRKGIIDVRNQITLTKEKKQNKSKEEKILKPTIDHNRILLSSKQDPVKEKNQDKKKQKNKSKKTKVKIKKKIRLGFNKKKTIKKDKKQSKKKKKDNKDISKKVDELLNNKKN